MRTSARVPHQKVATRLFAALAAVAILGPSVQASASAPESPPEGYVPANIRVARAVAAFDAKHPDDYVGLNRVIVAAGGDPVRFDFAELGLFGLSPTEAQKLVDSRDEGLTTLASSAGPISVSGYWSHVQDQYGEWYTYFGNWNFSDTYSGGGPPLDGVAVATSNVSASCWVFDHEDIWSYNRNGGSTDSLTNRKGVTFDSVVYQVDDSYLTSDAWYVDHGTVYISYKRLASCAGAYLYASTFYEHNHGGSGVWTYSVNSQIFNVQYSNSDPDTVIPVSTTLNRVWA